ncbi:MAG: anaerobic sulfatase maturase [Propionibacteriaceae bacterium]|nr:anaerobic sulfatase maturase [Propionibacteriaceae bacterium]
MVKPVGSLCNLRCTYCYYLSTPRLGPPRMADDVLERLIARFIAASPGPEVSFVWHGGEPTLAGLGFYERVVALEQKYLPDGWQCWNSLQTNGVLLDDAWADFLVAHRFDVGLSIDGTSWIHDEFRPDPGGRGSYRAAAAAAGRLMARGLRPDLLCTVTSVTAAEPLAVYRNLKSFGTGWMQFIPIVNRDATGALTSESVTGQAYGDFLCAIFDEWVRHDLGTTDVQLFAETARIVAGGQPGLCWMAPTCGRALVVESDGGVYSCDHFVTPAHRLGDVVADGLGTLVDSDVQRQFGQAKRDGLPARCTSCPWLGFCNGGCPKDRDGDGLNVLCPGLERFFAHAVPVLRQVAERARHGATTSAIMAELQQQAAAAWQGVGRNDPCPCGSGRKAKDCCWAIRPR